VRSGNRVLLSSSSLEDSGLNGESRKLGKEENRKTGKRVKSITGTVKITGTGCIQNKHTQKKRAPWARVPCSFLF